MQTFSVGQSALGSQEARTAAPPPNPVTAERLHYLDPMRGLLMMLGVVLHTASVFSLSGTWVVWDRENASGWMTQLGEFIHVFRMPAFFVVSGLLFARSVRSRGVGQVLRARLVRIGVPLIVVMLTVNTSERLLVLQASGSDLSAEEFLLNELVSGHWLGHLWFLFVLLGLMTTAALGNRALVRVAKSLPTRTGILLPVLAPGLVVGIHAAAKIIEPLNWLFMSITPATWLVSFTFFASGCVMGHRDDILQGFARLQAPLVALPIYALAWAASPNRVLEVYSATVLSWIGVTVCFIVFASLFNGRPSERGRLLIDSSYSVYLFHHLAVVLLGFLAIDLRFSLPVEFILVCGGALAISLVIHTCVIQQSRIAAFLFNGVPLPGTGVKSSLASDTASAVTSRRTEEKEPA